MDTEIQKRNLCDTMIQKIYFFIYFYIIEINNTRVDLTDISAKKESLLQFPCLADSNSCVVPMAFLTLEQSAPVLLF